LRHAVVVKASWEAQNAGSAKQIVGRIIERWNIVVGKGGIVYSEFKKQYDEIAD
jgi:hypothetical protein